jgi:D-3-phosphoglycerate dehydrogenase
VKDHAQAAARIEKDKALFGGHELDGKTLGVVGLGQIGGRVVNAALALGMKVVGYDPELSLEAAWQLPGDRVERAKSLDDLVSISDFITLHVPYMPSTHHMLGKPQLARLKKTAHLVNFARGELVDSEELRNLYDRGHTGKYVTDFADEFMHGHPKTIMLPHLGASTEEAEENSAAMAAKTVKDFLLTGAIRHSVNFPTCSLAQHRDAARLCIVNQNEPGVLGRILSFLGQHNINITQQINMSRGNIAYTVVDIENFPRDPTQLQEELGHVEGIISSRFIGKPFLDELGMPGTFFRQYTPRK